MNEWLPREDELERARAKTAAMRTSTEPQWREARERLQEEGLTPDEAVLASWENEGPHVMGGIIATGDGRVFDFMVTYGFDRDGQAIQQDTGWIQSWKEIAPERIGPTSTGHPNSWAQAAIIARLLFEGEGLSET